MPQVKDRLASWFIQNFVISKSQVFDKPGFILFKITGKSNLYSRQLIMPESFFSNLEIKICESLREEGEKLLYSLGKKFGKRFAIVGGIKSFENSSSEEFKKYVYLLVRFVEGTYSSGITYNLDTENKSIKFKIKNFIICSTSGKGFFLSAGGIAGIWSQLLGDPSIEAVHYKCQGRGDPVCEIEAAPIVKIKKDYSSFFSDDKIRDMSITEQYFSLNSPATIENSTKSFQSFLDSTVFSYKGGIIKSQKDRFFIIEASILDLIEETLSGDQRAIEIFRKVSFEAGSNLMEANSNLSSLTDLCAAFGFGDLIIIKKQEKFIVNFNYFPWTKFSEKSNNIFLEEFISGALSKINKKEIKVKKSFSGFNGKGYSLTLSQ
jgi:predicted hydrocarbon binding protein